MKIFQTHRISKHPLRLYLTPSHFLGIFAFIAAFLLFFINIHLAILPLAIFILICLIAPFFPKFSFFLPIITSGISEKQAVALTFDDGPDPQTTLLLLNLLSRYNVKATFFVTGEKTDKYPELINKILTSGHSIGNHSYSHDPFIMLKSVHRLREEIEKTQKSLQKQGITPLVFRPPVGITNPKLYKILDMKELSCVNFNRRAKDRGNKRVNHLSEIILKHVKANDIILLHDKAPKKDSELNTWIMEIEKLLSGISYKGLIFLPLSEIIGSPVMKITNTKRSA